MPDTPTPGQVNYEAAWRAHPDPAWAPADWYDLPPPVQAAWEAAAQAVLKGQEGDIRRVGDGLVHYVEDIARWNTWCGERQHALSGTTQWQNVTCPACIEHRAIQEGEPHA